MQAYEFQSTVENGVINIPDIYRDKINSTVKVIVLTEEGIKRSPALRLTPQDQSMVEQLAAMDEFIEAMKVCDEEVPDFERIKFTREVDL